MDDAEETMSLLCAIAEYFRRNPMACDTQQGIAVWWLGKPDAACKLVQRALKVLEELGIVEVLHALDGRARYRMATTASIPERTEELIQLAYLTKAVTQ